MINAYAAREAGAKLEPFEFDPGTLGVDEVEIDVQYCGICHSDKSMIDNEWGMSQYPLVPGHEVVGTVSSVGNQINHLLVGDVVGLGWHSGYCMTCPSCLSGDHNLCETAQPTIAGHNGGFADKVRAKAASVVRLPEALDKESAGPLFCGGITVFNPLIQYGVKPTDSVGVIGIGGLGHLAIQFYNAWGCEVTAYTSTEQKKSDALEMGAHYAVNSVDPAALEAQAGKHDFIISTVNVGLEWNSYLMAMKPKGRFIQVGAVLSPMEISSLYIIMGQRLVGGSSVGSPGTIAKMLDFAARHKIKPVIETYKLKDVNTAIERLRSGEARYRIVLTN